MRILFVAHNPDLYGASRALLRLALRLRRDGHELMAALPENGPLGEELAALGAGVRIVQPFAVVDRAGFATWGGRFRLATSFPAAIAALRRVQTEFRPDVVHSNTAVLLASGPAARSASLPHVHHVREIFDDFPGFWKIYRRFLTGNATRLACISEAVAAQFPDREKVRIIHDALPAEELGAPTASDAIAFRTRHGVPADAPLAVLAGRIKLKRKGQETFVAAAALLKDRFPAARFAIVGAPFAGNEDHLATLQRMVAEAGLGDHVVFTGELANVAEAFAAADVAVTASGTPEPFGLVTIEAMAVGRPVVGTNIGGTPEIVADGRTGLLVPPGDPAAMATALGRLFADAPRRDAMGRAGRARFLAEFEFEPHYARMLALYREAAGGCGTMSP